MGVNDLAELIATSLDGRSAAVEALVFGSEDPKQIAGLFGELCAAHLGSTLEGGERYVVSVGCVAIVQLANGRRVVVKAYQPRWSAPFLSSVRAAQAQLARDGFPCARPIGGPMPVGRGHALIDEYLPDPGASSFSPALLPVSARGLADLVARLRGVEPTGFVPHPMDRRVGVGDLYPEPHSPIFDFAATAAGAEWIDELAAAALHVRDSGPGRLTVAHCDWSLRNVRLDADGVLAVYDWDSLAAVKETTAVGQAAATWSSHDCGPAEVPSIEEIAEWVAYYERARGQPFTHDDRSRAGAAALWNIAYIARCEHAVDPGHERHRQARPRLAADGDRLLSLADLLP